MDSMNASIGKLLVIDSNVLFAKRLTNALRDKGFGCHHTTWDASYALTNVLTTDTPELILCATNRR